MLLESVEDRVTKLETVVNESLAQQNDLMDKIINVTDRVKNLESSSTDVINMKKEIKSLQTQLKRHENNSVACDLRINGIPFEKSEDLTDMFIKICSVIGVSVPAIKSIYRLQNQNNRNKNDSRDAAIIVKMWSPYDKNFFLKSLTNFKKTHNDFYFNLTHVAHWVELR